MIWYLFPLPQAHNRDSEFCSWSPDAVRIKSKDFPWFTRVNGQTLPLPTPAPHHALHTITPQPNEGFLLVFLGLKCTPNLVDWRTFLLTPKRGVRAIFRASSDWESMSSTQGAGNLSQGFKGDQSLVLWSSSRCLILNLKWASHLTNGHGTHTVTKRQPQYMGHLSFGATMELFNGNPKHSEVPLPLGSLKN